MSVSAVEDLTFQALIIGSDAAVLYYQVRRTHFGKHPLNICRRVVNQDVSVIYLSHVAVLLPAINIGLGKRNPMTECVQIFVDAPVISGGAVPIG